MNRKPMLALLPVTLILAVCLLILSQSASAQPPVGDAQHHTSSDVGQGRSLSPDSITYPLSENFDTGDFNRSEFHSVVPTCVPGGCGWSLNSPGHSNPYAAFAPEMNNVSDQQLTLWSPIAVPSTAVSATLSFWHSYGFEQPNFDGGVLEVSTNGGSSWTDVLSTTNFISGGYTG